MAAVDDLDQVIEQFQLALGELVKGNPGPCKKVFSHRDDVSLANRFGPRAWMGAGWCDSGVCRLAGQRWRDR